MSLPLIPAWMTRSSSEWEKYIIFFTFFLFFLPFFPPSLCSITPSHVSAPDFLLFFLLIRLFSFFHSISHLPRPVPTHAALFKALWGNIWVTHRVSQPVPPGLPQQAVPAVVEAVSSGELVPGVPGVSSLSPDHRQKGQPAQIHLEKTHPQSGFCQIMRHTKKPVITFSKAQTCRYWLSEGSSCPSGHQAPSPSSRFNLHTHTVQTGSADPGNVWWCWWRAEPSKQVFFCSFQWWNRF